MLRKSKKKVVDPTRHVFIFKMGNKPDATCYVVRGVHFAGMFGRADVNMKLKKVQPMVDKLLREYIRSKEPSNNIEFCEDQKISHVLIETECTYYDLYPVLVFLSEDYKVLTSEVCVDLSEHPLSGLLLKRIRRLRKKAVIAA